MARYNCVKLEAVHITFRIVQLRAITRCVLYGVYTVLHVLYHHLFDSVYNKVGITTGLVSFHILPPTPFLKNDDSKEHHKTSCSLFVSLHSPYGVFGDRPFLLAITPFHT